MKRIAFKLCIYLMVLSLLTACTFFSLEKNQSPVSSSPQWVMDWIENPICSPPCWQGISPGITTIAGAQEQQTKYPNMSIESENGAAIVQIVKLNLSYYDILPINILISKYGEPNYVRIFKCDPNNKCETHVIFDNLGMVLNLYLEDEGIDNAHAVTISSNSNILKIYFMQSGLDNYFAIGGFEGNIQRDLIPWSGYKRY